MIKATMNEYLESLRTGIPIPPKTFEDRLRDLARVNDTNATQQKRLNRGHFRPLTPKERTWAKPQ